MGKKPGREVRPAFTSWMTTDAEERKKRQERAAMEPMKVRAVSATDGFGRYEVSHPAVARRFVDLCRSVVG